MEHAVSVPDVPDGTADATGAVSPGIVRRECAVERFAG